MEGGREEKLRAEQEGYKKRKKEKGRNDRYHMEEAEK